MADHNISIIPANDGLGVADEHMAVISRAICAALEHQNVDVACDIYVMITDDEGIRELNREHRELDRATDVLSFPMQELTPGEPINPSPLEIDPETGLYMLGDMVISLERAKAQAQEYGHSLERELAFLAVHSVLHLLGYDHERGEQDEKLQFGITEQVLEGIGIKREA